MKITEELMQIIQAKANTIMSSDNQEFNAYEYSGGNFDDAYYMGVADGEVAFARDILIRLGLFNPTGL